MFFERTSMCANIDVSAPLLVVFAGTCSVLKLSIGFEALRNFSWDFAVF